MQKEGDGDLLLEVPEGLIIDKCFERISTSTPPKAFFEWVGEMEAAVIKDLKSKHGGKRAEHLE
jgi:hypothetical protein